MKDLNSDVSLVCGGIIDGGCMLDGRPNVGR